MNDDSKRERAAGLPTRNSPSRRRGASSSVTWEPMGKPRALQLCAVMASMWDQREWSDVKMDLFSSAIADLDYVVTSAAIRHLFKRVKWQPLPAEIRELHDREMARRARQAQHAQDRRLLAAPQERDETGKLVALRPIRDVIQRLTEKLALEPRSPIFRAPDEGNDTRPLSPGERNRRLAALRGQAQRLRGR